MGKIIVQLLSCLYLYDSGIQVPVRIRKPKSVYRFLTPGVDIPCQSRATGIPTSDATGKFAQPVYRLLTPQESLRKAGIPASDVLRVKCQSIDLGNEDQGQWLEERDLCHSTTNVRFHLCNFFPRILAIQQHRFMQKDLHIIDLHIHTNTHTQWEMVDDYRQDL